MENHPGTYISDGKGHICNIPPGVSTEIFNLVRKECQKKNKALKKEFEEL